MKTFLFQITSIIGVYLIGKNIFKYLLKLNSEKNFSDYKSEATAENMKNMIKNHKRNEEINEIVNNATLDEFNKLR